MAERLHVHVPWPLMEANLPFLIERRLQPEVAFSGPDLDGIDGDALESVGRALAQAGLAVTVHGPFHDLNPGGLEPLVVEVTRRRFTQTLQAADRLGARLVVFHPGFDRWKYGGRNHLWLEGNLRFWPPLIEQAARQRCILALENIFEPAPTTLAALMDEIDSPWLGHCFDVGHWALFADLSLPAWFDVLGRRTRHLHLHDNFGQADDHLAVGEGTIDFATLFQLVETLGSPPSMTLEAHDRTTLLRSLAGIAPFIHR
jgi:sugar phosphate isomerase/epimerase